MDVRLRRLNTDLYQFRHLVPPMISGSQNWRKGRCGKASASAFQSALLRAIRFLLRRSFCRYLLRIGSYLAPDQLRALCPPVLLLTEPRPIRLNTVPATVI